MPFETTTDAINRRLLFYFALAFFISWLLWLPLVASSQNWISADAPFTLYYLGVVGPTLAAIILVWIDHGRSGVWSLLCKLTLWQVNAKWYVVALFLPGAIRFSALGLLYLFGLISPDFSLRPWRELIANFLLMLLLVPFEEIGWRGYALPRLQTRFGALWASLLLGVMWSLWHLPPIWVSGSYQESNSPLTYIFVFTVTILPITILFTWLYNHTKSSLLLATLFHAAINTSEWALIIQENDGRLLLFAACALYSAIAAMIIVGWRARKNR